MANEYMAPSQLSDQAKRVIQELHHEAHAHGKCTCGLSEADEANALWEAEHEFDAEMLESAASDPADVEAVLAVRQWFGLPALV